MNKRIKMVLSAATLALTLTVTALPAHADTVSELRQELIAAGVPEQYVGNVVDYLQNYKITQAEANQVKSKINEAKALIGGETDVTKLDASVKTQVQSLVKQAASIINLNASFGKDSNGKITIAITTPSGGTLAVLSSDTSGGAANNFNVGILDNIVDISQNLQNDSNGGGSDDSNGGDSNDSNNGDEKPNNPEFKPDGGGDLNNTATPYGNLMLAGTTMMGMAGGLHVISKKRK